ncbi:MAG: CoA activase [Myxococcales bacterium]|nr:CoA activase [Myxococcales bacterium]
MHAERFIGIDIGAETVKVAEVTREGESLRWTRRAIAEHHQEPRWALTLLLQDFDWGGLKGAASTGRLSRLLGLPRVPPKQALSSGLKQRFGDEPATVVSIGAHGFSVLEVRQNGTDVFRENSRCSQGTGNFLRQLVERFDLSVEQANELVTSVSQPAPLSGRCPVILKTDMTHLANKGEDRARILAGLFDAVCENVQVLIKPRVSPPRVVLSGGVTRSRRVQESFRRFLARHEMQLLPPEGDDALFLEALGAAVESAARPLRVPSLQGLFLAPPEASLERVPALSKSLAKVRRMSRPPLSPEGDSPVILGFDIGSTGSKAVAVDARNRAVAWEGYLRTNGDPVGAAQSLARKFLEGPAGKRPVVALGATGSGREIAGSLMSVCYGPESVFVLNEIAAHAEGALHYDSRVDTIFEIGGQDAKYIRLAEGRVVDSAMNEACSAGTGSFIEEQGRRFSGISDVTQLGEEALQACTGVSLGQHCSVFMAEIIDEAVASGVEQRSIVAGIYDSIIQNYLNRVKGNRSVGQVIFCQGMPFSADALAAAVARQTGGEVIVPPNPGTVGALGIALLSLKELGAGGTPVDLRLFLCAKVEKKDTFVCNSTQGCGEAGNRCRIDRLTTAVGEEKRRFTWGGGCSLYDKGTRKKKLPDLSPDPFRERADRVRALVERLSDRRGRKVVGLTDEFSLKGLLPFFATYLHELGFDLLVRTGADRKSLKRGIEEANVPFCAPMQLFHGLVSELSEQHLDYLFVPMLRGLPRMGDERYSTLCPIVQASGDMLRWNLGERLRSKILSPVIDIGPENLRSRQFIEGCHSLGDLLGAPESLRERAFLAALEAQTEFDEQCRRSGRRALEFCAQNGVVPVVVLGRPYTLHNDVLNSNVPAILREQGAVAIPVDCYPVEGEVPVFQDMFWAHGQRNLRAAHQIRRAAGIYSLFCSNYSCGPDSFTIHFYSYLMEGRPFAIIETDGHSGDAGTKTRVEAFLHCVREDIAAPRSQTPNSLKRIEQDRDRLPEVRRREERVLIPRMGPAAETFAAALRGIGVPAEALPTPDREALQIGRRYTSGKECVPMTITLGSLLKRLERERDTKQRFCFFMPTSQGPCRFGTYQVLHKITLERLGWKDRVKVWSPRNEDYFEDVPDGFAALVFAGLIAADMLLDALHDVRPVESKKGAANELYRRYQEELSRKLEAADCDLNVAQVLWEAASGRMFGLAELLERAAADFARVKVDRPMPTVLVVGEIYARCDPFANDYVIDRLEKHGIRSKLAPFTEWLEYTDFVNKRRGVNGFGDRLSSLVQKRVRERCYQIMAAKLGWPSRTKVEQTLEAAEPYLRDWLEVESVLTLGGGVHEVTSGHVDGVISPGPLECMPNKIAESQYFHAAEKDGVLSLTLALNGDPVDEELLEGFAFEVHAR